MANDPKRPTGMTTSGGLYGTDDDGEAIENAVSLGRRPGVGRPQQPVDPSVTPERLVPRQQGKSEAMRQASPEEWWDPVSRQMRTDRNMDGSPAVHKHPPARLEGAPGMPGEVEALKLRTQKPYPPLESYIGDRTHLLRLDKGEALEEGKNMSMRTILDGLAGKVRDPDATYHDHATGEVRRMDGTGIEHDPYDQLVQQAEAEEPDPDFAEVEGVEVAPGMTYEESVKAFGVITAAAQHGGPGQGEPVPFRRPVTASEMAAKQDEAAATRRAMTAEERIRREGASSQPLVFHPGGRTVRLVSMIEHKGTVYVATERHVYRLEGDRLVPLQFDRLPDAP